MSKSRMILFGLGLGFLLVLAPAPGRRLPPRNRDEDPGIRAARLEEGASACDEHLDRMRAAIGHLKAYPHAAPAKMPERLEDGVE